MKNLLLISLLIVAACKAPIRNHYNATYRHQHIDTSKYAILKLDSTKTEPIFGIESLPASISSAEIEEIDSLLNRRVNDYNKDEQSIYEKDSIETKIKFPNAQPIDNRIRHPEKYYKQVVAITNSRGEKQVWVNCFCDAESKSSTLDKSYWKNGIVIVMDGGSCYFNLKINLTELTVYDFRVNGIA